MKKINEEFVCINCGNNISKAEKTCRNHCNICFTSLHVDGDVPGDRQGQCGGTMYPVEYEIRNGEFKILFVCVKCGKKHYNKALPDDDITRLDEFIYNYKRFF